MAAQTNPLNGSWFFLEVSTDSGTSYDKVGLGTSVSMEGSTGERDTSSQENCGYAAFQPSRKETNISFEGLVMFADATGYLRPDDLFTLWDGRTNLLWKLTWYDCNGDAMTGEFEYSGAGYINSFSISASQEETVTVSTGIKVNGAVTQTVIA